MVTHIVKTTIDIADDLFERVQQLAQKDKTTFRALTEEGLRLMLLNQKQPRAKKLPPAVTFGKGGLRPEFEHANWEKIRDEIYKGRGA